MNKVEDVKDEFQKDKIGFPDERIAGLRKVQEKRDEMKEIYL